MDQNHLRQFGRLASAVALLVFAGSSQLMAEQPEDPSVTPFFGRPSKTAPFRDTEFGAHAHYGSPDSPDRGHPQYDLPSQHYGEWYRPRAFGWGKKERCEPRPFLPRGLGNLGNPRSTCNRMDYHPYVVKDARSRYGPSYFQRQPDPRCDYDCLCGRCSDAIRAHCEGDDECQCETCSAHDRRGSSHKRWTRH
jgi:hypothetical protein